MDFKRLIKLGACIWFVLSPPAQAKWELESGALVTNITERISVPEGFSQSISQIQGFLGVARSIPITRSLHFVPRISTLIPGRKGRDGQTYVFSSHALASIEKDVFSRVSVSAGVGIWWESMFSQGESLEQFYTPSRWTQIVVPTLALGSVFQFSKKLGLRTMLIIPQFYLSHKRRVYASLGIGIHL